MLLQPKSLKWSSLILAIVLVFGIVSSLLPVSRVQASPVTGMIYYVDATGGNDSHTGTSEGTAWKTLEKVNATTFQPGDQILLKSGEVWEGQLWPKGSGSPGMPIIIDQYGSGSKPAIQGKGLVQDAVRLFNQEYWEIHHVDVSNAKPATATPGENLGDYRGIHISGDNSTTLDYFRIVAVDVHDVTGQINWISGTQPVPPQPGIRFKTGWDGSKKTGGIVFDTTVPNIFSPPSQATVINDVIVEQSTITNTSFAGITFKQYTGDGKDADGNTIAVSTGWGERANGTDPKFTPHTNIIIRDNYITQKDTAYGCNAMYLTDIRGGLVENNVVYKAGTSGIEMYYADDIVVQHNEVYETTQKAGGADSNGIDPDKATTKILIQYNYIHDNGDGILICQFSFGDTVIRNNVIKSNTRYPIYLHSDKKAIAEVYNNTIYNDKSNYLIYGYGTSLDATYNIRNNNLYTTRAGATITTSGTTFYENNNYYGTGLMIPTSDTKALQVDPKFVSTVSGPSGTIETGPRLDSALGFRSKSGSAMINAGIAMPNNGSKDYAGKTLYNGLPDIGAFEYYTEAGSTTESVNGKVKDGSGKAVAGAKISMVVNTVSYTATSDAKGSFVIADVPLASGVELKTEKTGYTTTTTTIAIQPPNMTTLDIVITSTSPYGILRGTILDEKMSALEGVSAKVMYEGEEIASGTTDHTGILQLGQVPIGENYTIVLSKAGYFTVSKGNVSITPESLTDIGKVLLSSKQPQVLYNHTFNNLSTGTLSSGNNLTVSASGGSVEVAEVPGVSDKSVLLTRSSNSGSTSLSQTFATPLTGIVTIEADLKRKDTYVSGNNWISLPYVYGSTNLTNPGISFAFDKGTIKGYKGTTTTDFMKYVVGQWYNTRMVIDMAAQSFDLYIDGIKIVDRAPYRIAMADIKKIDFYANSTNYGSVYIDNVRITQGIGYSKSDATLAELSSDAGTLTRLDETHYAIQVPSNVEQVNLTPVASSPNVKSILVNGVPVGSGNSSDSIALTGDDTDIPVVVTAEDNLTTATYTVSIHRISAQVDASLQGLLVNGGTLSPDFDPSITLYQINVPYYIHDLTLVPTAGNSQADITINGKTVLNGATSEAIPLVEGQNLIVVYVVSPDGTANETYEIGVHRANSPYGQISGTVKDQSNHNVFGAHVTLTKLGDSRTTITDATGTFTFSDVMPDTEFTVTAQKAGYDEATMGNVTVTVGQTTSVNPLFLQAHGAIASLTGVAEATPGQSMQSTFQINNVSSSVYSAVYSVDLIVGFDSTKLQWISTLPSSSQLQIIQSDQTAEGSLTMKVLMADVNQAIPPDTDLFVVNWKVKDLAPAGETVIRLTRSDVTNGRGDLFQATASEHALEIKRVVIVDPDPRPDPDPTTDPSPDPDPVTKPDTGTNTTKDPSPFLLESNDQGTATITKANLESAIQSTQDDSNGKKVIVVNLKPNNSSLDQVGLLLPAELLKAKEHAFELKLQSELGTIVISDQMLNGLGNLGDMVEIRLKKANSIDNHPVYDIQLLANGESIAWHNPEAPVTIQIPYLPSQEEKQNPDHIAVFYVNPQGQMIPVPNGHYDVQSGQVIFTTKHFSQYAIMYKSPTFMDLASVKWAQASIETLAAKGVIEGRNIHEFDPQNSITRADFIVLLMRALDLATRTTDAFTDVASHDYYFNALTNAKAYGITTGTGNNLFEPMKQITREDTMVLTARALQVSKQLPSRPSSIEVKLDYTDASDISDYAKGSIAALTAEGFVQGDETGIHPKQELSRAQAAVLIHRIVVNK
ncbi:hypothetical protein GC096_07425 [Paenibacillus sp. LMG 31461]|uniref:SLH domain-containing protein n=1 Tax=Paenibacillus plantarum TaxID=2654975 RepID=A0ABX1X5Z3_9BACL|nr:carboxypeptidase regulatory-like domain-containing protein [Paenibacillus plantarum]NOU63853.1 hypothetical protein [Paenibacillus plantarum]